MEDQIRDKMTVASEKAVLAAALFPDEDRDPHDPLGELQSLAQTAGAEVVDHMMQNRATPDPATFIGSGKVTELAEMVKFHDAQVIIFDNDLSPRQLANVEEIVGVKVLDRSELILDIFAARAQTTESKLQVELAQLEYTYPRLRAMWSHLERIGGGAPGGIGTRGPGEQQIEIDRRIVQRKKSVLKKEIVNLQGRKEREVEKRNRDFFTVGLVGYTNAGKSTLFNTSTGDKAYADDKLFATLSTRTRRWDLGDGDKVMLSDTVGFVRDLPHHLVASFKATLEEAVHSDLLLIVLDVSHPRCKSMFETVMQVLDDIGATQQPRLLLLNKIDRLQDNLDVLAFECEYPDCISLSAKTGVGVDKLVERVRTLSRGEEYSLKLAVNMADGRALQFIEARADITDRQYEGDEVIYELGIGQRQFDQLRSMGAKMRIIEGKVQEQIVEPWTK
jgi:GTPase